MDQKQPIKINVPTDKAAGAYCNLVSITIGENEMILDFAQMIPNKEDAELVSRVVMTPQVGKNFMSAFQNAILDFDIARGKRQQKADDAA